MKFIEYTSPTSNKTYMLNIAEIEQVIGIAGKERSTIVFNGERTLTVAIEYSVLKEMIKKAS